MECTTYGMALSTEIRYESDGCEKDSQELICFVVSLASYDTAGFDVIALGFVMVSAWIGEAFIAIKWGCRLQFACNGIASQ